MKIFGISLIVLAVIISIIILCVYFSLNGNRLSLFNFNLPTPTLIPPSPIVCEIITPVSKTLSGKIIDVNKNSITLRISSPKTQSDQSKSNPVAGSLQMEEKDYKINISSDAQIFKLILSAESLIPTREAASVKDLKKGMRITVYTDSEVTATDSLTATYLEIAPLPSNPALPAE